MKKILVIEDEDNIRSFVVINLKRAGYTVVEAASGEEAFEVLAKNPDVILSASGMECAERTISSPSA